MADIAAPELKSGQASQPAKLVEMNWDPITRIVGSLGIYTKIDFSARSPSATALRRFFAATASS
jgi:hydrogenase large subunit